MKYSAWLLFSISLFYSCISSGKPVPLNSSIMIFNDYDLQKCDERVGQAYDQNNKRIHIIPTIYAKLSHQKIVSYYYKDKHAQTQSFTHKYMKEYQSKLLSCLRYAHDLGIQIYLTPHIDDIKSQTPRLHIDFSPSDDYSGLSYAQIMFKYLGRLSTEVQKNIYLSLIGENGKSLYLYTSHYKALVNHLPSSLKLGLSFNFSNHFGSIGKFKKIDFIDKLDFLGVSAYYSIPKSCSSESFEIVAQRFWNSMRSMGMTKKIRLHFTEIGVGGSSLGSYVTSRFPYKGQSGAYDLTRDPWQIGSNYQYRKKYYQCLLSFLKKTPTIQAAFLWNSDSWDVQGFYPYSLKYRDEDISKWISQHNYLSK